MRRLGVFYCAYAYLCIGINMLPTPLGILPTLSDREYSRYRKDYWKHKQEQAELVLDAKPARVLFEEQIAFCEVTLGRNGGVWL